MRSPLVAAAALFGVVALTAGCGGSEQAAAPSTATGVTRGSRDSTSNERRLTPAQSLRLVDWATAFRSCMRGRDTSVGALAKSETRIQMTLAAGAEAADVLPDLIACGAQLGDPPQQSSLQYRAGKILLYLPKQCLLDEKVAES